MPHAAAAHVQSDFGRIVVQEIQRGQALFRHLHITWEKPVNIVCSYQYKETVLSVRVSGNNPLHESIKGAGNCSLPPHHFYGLAGSSWTSLLSAPRRGAYEYVEIVWPADVVLASPDRSSDISRALLQSIPFVPDRVLGPPYAFDSAMQRTLQDILRPDLPGNGWSDGFRHAQKLLDMMIAELEQQESVKMGIRQADRVLIQAAKELITENLDTQFTIPVVARKVGVNEFKLKKLFPKITGFKIEEYRRYLLCISVRNEMLQHKTPLKLLLEKAGYTNEPSLIRGCRLYLGCSPGELRRQRWNTDMPGGASDG